MSGGAIEVLRPTGPASAVVVSVPHAGRDFPADELGLYRVRTEELARAGDLWVDRLFADAPALGATVVRSAWSRFVVDLNRFSDDLSPTVAVGANAREADGYYGECGVIWAITPRRQPIYRRPLAADEVARRLERYHAPYHRLLADALARAHEEHGFAVLLDAHSMPSRAVRLEGESVSPADVIPGDVNGRTCHLHLRQTTESFWRDSGLHVRSNWIYPGGAISRTYGRPDLGVHAIQLELNRRLYMDEKTSRPHARFDALRARCAAFVERLTWWRPPGR